jgi:uncharacterized protein YbjT (DUF2867 family)
VLAATRRVQPPPPIAGIRYVYLDLTTGAGDALAEVDIVIHSATDPPNARRVDLEGMRTLVAAAPDAHFVYPSIVGCDLIPLPYYRVKTETEELLMGSAGRWTILRATQFHHLLWWWYATPSRNPFLFVPRDTRYQVIDPLEVAKLLVELALEGPRGRAGDIGGPHAYEAAELARSCLTATNSRRRVVRYNRFGVVGAALRAGANLTPHRAGGQTWNEFVAQQLEKTHSG